MTSPATQQVVTFRIGSDRFAADVAAVERILPYERPTPLPNLPPWVEGVLQYQECVVPVIDLRRRFGLVDAGAAPAGRVIIFMVGVEWIGAVVDSVLEVVTLPASQVVAPPPLFRGLSAEFVRGLIRRDGEGLVIFLDVMRLLSATEQLALEQGLCDHSGGADA